MQFGMGTALVSHISLRKKKELMKNDENHSLRCT